MKESTMKKSAKEAEDEVQPKDDLKKLLKFAEIDEDARCYVAATAQSRQTLGTFRGLYDSSGIRFEEMASEAVGRWIHFLPHAVRQVFRSTSMVEALEARGCTTNWVLSILFVRPRVSKWRSLPPIKEREVESMQAALLRLDEQMSEILTAT